MFHFHQGIQITTRVSTVFGQRPLSPVRKPGEGVILPVMIDEIHAKFPSNDEFSEETIGVLPFVHHGVRRGGLRG